MKIIVPLCILFATSSAASIQKEHESKPRHLRFRGGRGNDGSFWDSIFNFGAKGDKSNSTANGGGSSDSEACRPVHPAATCPYDPDTSNDVVCGENKCAYNNQCEASGAGWDEEDCQLANAPQESNQCPPVNETVPCIFVYAPVQCGANNCFYNNECEATGAGWAESDCSDFPVKDAKPVCPALSPLIRCADSDLNEQVVCGNVGCIYNNFCESNGAGWTEEECRTITISTVNTTTCPPMDSLLLCPPSQALGVEVVCGTNACTYPGLCEATGAGFAESDCKRKSTTTCNCITTPCDCDGEATTDCPAPSASVTCPYEPDTSNQVLCGENKCAYNNQCEASGAGFSEGQCATAATSATCPDVRSDVPCIEIYAPVTCGSNDCWYANQCQASAAGFEEGQCVSSTKIDFGDEQICPLPSPAVTCPYEPDTSNQVICGENNCAYNNLCEATGAGFSGDQCVKGAPTTTCPAVSPDVPCIEIYAPVTCGSNDCWYANQCQASAAGFQEGHCSSSPEDESLDEQDCPLPSPAVTCPYEPDASNQVVCGDTSCFYNNQCEATGAGFSEDQCVKQAPVVNCLCITYPCDCGSSSSSSCPLTKSDVMCTTAYIPVVCGDDKCSYSNACLAAGAGWDADQCSPANN